MSEHVWLSTMMLDSSLIPIMRSDLSDGAEGDKEAGIKGSTMLERGEPVPPELCPKKIWADPKSFKLADKLPDLFIARGYWIVSGRARDVLVNFDLGNGALYPVSAFLQDQVTPFEETYFCWVLGNRKATVSFEHSQRLRIPSGPPGYVPDIRRMPSKLQDDEVAVSSAALAGPDVWLDDRLATSVFLSGPLGDALAKAKLRKAFRLVRARVISAVSSKPVAYPDPSVS